MVRIKQLIRSKTPTGLSSSKHRGDQSVEGVRPTRSVEAPKAGGSAETRGFIGETGRTLRASATSSDYEIPAVHVG